MSTGKIEERFEPEFGRFEDEVLNAEWQRPELQLGLQPVSHHRDRAVRDVEIESFLNAVYYCQE
ncbi:MAG: hypothetical protein KJ634_11700 [Gammaproteobacteria bacterium]|nr:hypothetical protein [Gammaproteobacteria bacterium]MBU1416280.1 hypothetical protein [Gammaproteobacteria bacterium]